MDLRMSLSNQRREYTRIRALPTDPRVKLLREAFGACETRLRCRTREHLRDGEYLDAERLVGVVDDLVLHGATTDGLLGIGQALNAIVEMTVYDGNAAPKESVGESFAAESMVEGQTNAAVALAMDAPKSPGRARAAIQWINRHIAELVRQRVVFQRESRHIEAAR